jgi:hypothetical protein
MLPKAQVVASAALKNIKQTLKNSKILISRFIYNRWSFTMLANIIYQPMTPMYKNLRTSAKSKKPSNQFNKTLTKHAFHINR